MKKNFISILIIYLVTVLWPASVLAVDKVPPNLACGDNSKTECYVQLDQTCPSGYSPTFVNGNTLYTACDKGNTAQEAQANANKVNGVGSLFDWTGWVTGKLMWLPGAISIGVMKIASMFTYIAGGLLNWVVQYTVVNMAQNINSQNINNTWKVIRDVGNMGFIFVLLYAAIKTIIGQGENNQRLIVNIVIAAVLMNFSLFFTKIVIDASNVIAITFYDRIAPGSLTAPQNLWAHSGIANAMMQQLKVQTIWDGTNWAGTNLLIIGIMGTIFCLIAAFVFVAVSLLFITRFILLLILLALSPIVFLAMVLPGSKKYSKQWIDALIGQATFAPVYFLMTWVILALMKGIMHPSGSLLGAVQNPGELSSVGLIVNFLIVVGFLIASIIVSKQLSDKTGYGFNKITGWAMGAAGGATFGMAGRLGRNTVGRMADARANNQDLKDRASEKGMRGMAARMQLATARKAAGSSFDYRAGNIGGVITGKMDAGKTGGKGGFVEYKKKQAESEAKYAQSLAPGDEVINIAEQNLKTTKEFNIQSVSFQNQRTNERVARSRTLDILVAQRDRETDPVKKAELVKKVNVAQIEYDKTNDLDSFKKDLIDKAQAKVDKLKGVDDNRAKDMLRNDGKDENYIKSAEGKRDIADLKKENKSAGEVRKQAYADQIQDSYFAKIAGYNTAAAAQIRKGKSNKDKVADAVKALTEEDKSSETEETTPAAAGPTPAPTAPTPPAETP